MFLPSRSLCRLAQYHGMCAARFDIPLHDQSQQTDVFTDLPSPHKRQMLCNHNLHTMALPGSFTSFLSPTRSNLRKGMRTTNRETDSNSLHNTTPPHHHWLGNLPPLRPLLPPNSNFRLLLGSRDTKCSTRKRNGCSIR
jgi:hypothetical protein